ncbi:condensation domain-containing protein [Streptomyces sp. NPDC005374]|uniref:condensation domain-containing protein n=1 Tax=Streptomyces sp. NPDC005374 TaxID=3364713 RepID=UPI0036CC4492
MSDDSPVRVQRASALERQFWVGEQIAPSTRANRALALIRADGPVEHGALGAALSAVAARHEALRTAFVVERGELVRKVLPPRDVPPPLYLPAETGSHDAVAALLADDSLDLGAGRLFRAAVAPDDMGATVYLAVHHIAFDGMSQEIFAADLARAYALAVTGEKPVLPVRERAEPAALAPAQRAELATYWRTMLDGAADLPLPGSAVGPGPSQRQLAQADLAEDSLELPTTTWQAVRTRARHSGCSPYAVLLAALGRALAELTGGAGFCVGTPVAARTPDQSDEIGYLTNTLPVRMPELSGPGVVERVWGALRESVIGSPLPCDEIIRAARTTPGRRMPVYQALFAFENWERAEHAAGPVRIRALPVPPVGGHAEIQLQVTELPAGTLHCVAQAPLSSPWQGRSAALLGAFADQLGLLCTDVAARSFGQENAV